MDTPDQAASRLRNLVALLRKNQNRIERSALLKLHNGMKARIFQQAEASDGSYIASKVKAKGQRVGDYSKSWGTKRNIRNRQTSRVDLSFTDGPGSLQASMKIRVKANENVFEFVTDDARNIGVYNEEYRKKEIFTPSKDEVKEQIEAVVEEIKAVIKSAFK